MADHLKMYTPYAANLEAAKETYRRLWSELPQFERFVVAEQVPNPFDSAPAPALRRFAATTPSG